MGKIELSIFVLVAVLLSTSRGQNCADRNATAISRELKWFTIGHIDYTYTRRNARWKDAEEKCNRIIPGQTNLAKIDDDQHWRQIKQVVDPGWYWMDNINIAQSTNNRFFHYDGKVTRVYLPDRPGKRCLIYAYPGTGTTDFYRKETWARILCEVRCDAL